ncbi:MAG: ParA family protein [Candidatus Omnitrophica bacterium]|nr:ParA family protein [Candidatus Omnitrophota bacterium]
MSKIASFCNQKGGVGKTTSVINLASILGQYGKKVLVIDVDSQANATSGFGIDKPKTIESTTYQLIVDKRDPLELIRETGVSNVSLIASNFELSGAELELISQEKREFSLKEQLSKIENNYDYIFIDCPPSLGLMTINALVASRYIIIPLQCEYYALEGLGQLLHTYHLVKQKLNSELEIGGVILTMADFRTNLTQQVIEEVKSYFKEKVFKNIIPRTVKLSEAPSFGKPAVIYDPHNKGSEGYRSVGIELLERFEGIIINRKNEANGINERGHEEGLKEQAHENDKAEESGEVAQYAEPEKIENIGNSDRGDVLVKDERKEIINTEELNKGGKVYEQNADVIKEEIQQ